MNYGRKAKKLKFCLTTANIKEKIIKNNKGGIYGNKRRNGLKKGNKTGEGRD